jgi:hypothetical protein
MAAIPQGAVPAYTDALAIVLQHLPRRPQQDGESFTKSNYTRGLHKSERGSAAGVGGDRVDYLLQAAWDRDGGVLDQLFEFHNHIANGTTPEPVGQLPDQHAQDEFCWWLILYMLPRWLLSELTTDEIDDDAFLGASRPVRLRCRRFFNCDWQALHAMSSTTTGSASSGRADDNDEDITPAQRRAARCEFLANLDEYGRAASALVGTSGVLSENLCSSLGEGGSHLWDLCTQRARMLHPAPDPTDGLDKHWTSAENAAVADPGVTREDATFLDQHETVDVEWGEGQVATAVHGDARALGIKVGDRVVAVDGAQLDPNSALAADLRVGLHEVNHRPLTLTIERSKRPRPQLGGLPPELVNLHFAGKLVLLHKGTDDEFRKLLDDPGAATIDQVALRPISIGVHPSVPAGSPRKGTRHVL